MMTNEQRQMAAFLMLDPACEDVWPMDKIEHLLRIRARSLADFDAELDITETA